MKKTLLLMVSLLFMGMQMLVAQRTITGTVISESDMLGIPGVSVRAKGTEVGTTTDITGRYQITVPATATVLQFSYVGMQSQDIEIGGKTTIDVVMSSAMTNLEEVIIVAYGTAKKSSFTGSATMVSGDVIERPSSNISKALQGISAGVQSTSTSGQPGAEATIRIRGVGSINASSNPLYVVDGVPYDGNLSSINPDDIASITVLKDAASASLYGSRGANGVIVVQTKSGGKNSKMSTNVKATYGISNRAVRDYEKVSTDDYFMMTWEALYNQGGRTPKAAQNATDGLLSRLMGTGPNPYGSSFSKPVGTDGKLLPGATPLWDFDWTKALEQPARRTDLSVNFSGGSEKTNYYVSAGYLDDQGILIGSGFKRYNFRSNVNTELYKWLAIGANIGYTHSSQDAPTSEDSNTGNVANAGRLIPNFYPIYQVNPDGSQKTDANGNPIPDYGSYRPASATPNWNLPATMPDNLQNVLRDQVSARGYAEIRFMPELKFKTSYNFDFLNYNSHFFTNPNVQTTSPYGSASRTNTRTFSYTFNNLLTYEKTLGKDHHISALAGMEAYEYDYRYLYGYRTNTIIPDFAELDAQSILASASGYSNAYSLVGYLARAEYTWRSKVHVSASFRRDGSSRFHIDNRWGNFWSIGASWRLSEEGFMESTRNWLSNLSLRASYGAQGNDQVGTYYASEGLYNLTQNLGQGAAITSRLPTPDLKWETNLNTNIGLDFGFFNGRLSGTFEYFVRQSKDLIFSRALAPSLGYTSIQENVGSLRNGGVEIDLKGYVVRTKDWSFQLGANFTHYKNVITKMSYEGEEIISGTKKLMKGRSIYDFYMRQWAGVNPENGLAEWWVINDDGTRRKTQKFTDATLTYVDKSSLPKFYGGITMNLKYKGFALSALAVYSVGGYIYNGDITMIMGNGSSAGRAWHVDMINRWTPENTITDVPKLGTSAPAGGAWTSQSDRFLFDGSYLRMKNITLSYDLPKTVLTKMRLSKLQVFVSGDNLFTLTKGVQGMDPEQAIDGSTYYRYPAMRTTSIGVNLSF